VADEDEAENELANPGACDGQVEEDFGLVGRWRSEGLVEGGAGLVGQLVEELAADVMVEGELGDVVTGENVEGEVATLVGTEEVGGTEEIGRFGGGRRGGVR